MKNPHKPTHWPRDSSATSFSEFVGAKLTWLFDKYGVSSTGGVEWRTKLK